MDSYGAQTQVLGLKPPNLKPRRISPPLQTYQVLVPEVNNQHNSHPAAVCVPGFPQRMLYQTEPFQVWDMALICRARAMHLKLERHPHHVHEQPHQPISAAFPNADSCAVFGNLPCGRLAIGRKLSTVHAILYLYICIYIYIYIYAYGSTCTYAHA